MLPKRFNLNNLDLGIKDLIITLNRIPGINEKNSLYGPTNCEGHLYNENSESPFTKYGWINFYKLESKEEGLIKVINQFCKENRYFSFSERLMNERDLNTFNLNSNQKFKMYKIKGKFWKKDRRKRIK